MINLHLEERKRLTDPRFLWILFIIGIVYPITVLIIKIVYSPFNIVFVVLGIIIFPVALLFLLNAYRLIDK